MLGVTPQALSTWISRNTFDVELIFAKCEGINPEWLLTGKGEMLKPVELMTADEMAQHDEEVAEDKWQSSSVSQSIADSREYQELYSKYKAAIEEKKEGIPLIPVEAMAGYGNGDVQVMDYDIQENYLTTPELEGKGIKYIIRASGSSMIPKYNNGDLLACRPVTDDSFIQWGKVYVLDTEQGPVVKRLYQSDDDTCLECRSDNFERYPPFKIRKESIRRIAIVVAVLRLE